MQNLRADMLVPAYLTRFSCLGPACPDDCCHGWRVDVEYDSFRRLQQLPDPELKPLLAVALKRGEGKRGSRNFGRLDMQADGRCRLLQQDGLCRLHARCGEAVLPDVCASYPRLTLRVGARLQQTASASCPEVARLLVEDGQAMQLCAAPREVRAATVRKVAESSVGDEVQFFFAALFGHAALPIWQRLALALLAAQSLDETLGGAGGSDALLDRLGQWRQALESGDALSAVSAWQRDGGLHLQLLGALSRLRLRKPLTRPRYRELVDEAVHGFNGGGDAAAAFADPQMDAVLGRVVHNHAFGHYAPQLPGPGLMAGVARLCVLYLTLRFWWAGLALARGRALTPPEQTELLFNFFREVVHNEGYLGSCADALGETGFGKPEHWLLVLPA